MNSVFDRLTEQKEDEEDKYIVSEEQVTDVHNLDDEARDRVRYTPREIKDTSQELLRHGLLDMESKPKLYQIAATQMKSINNILEPFDLNLKIDDVRGLAYLLVAESIASEEEDGWSHPLIRKQRLNMEQSLLLAILRELYVSHELENGIGSNNAVIPIADLMPRLRIYLGEMGSDNAEVKRTRNLLDKLKGHGVVGEVDKYDQVVIRPIITHIANPENLSGLLEVLRKKAAKESESIFSLEEK